MNVRLLRHWNSHPILFVIFANSAFMLIGLPLAFLLRIQWLGDFVLTYERYKDYRCNKELDCD